MHVSSLHRVAVGSDVQPWKVPFRQPSSADEAPGWLASTASRPREVFLPGCVMTPRDVETVDHHLNEKLEPLQGGCTVRPDSARRDPRFQGGVPQKHPSNVRSLRCVLCTR